MTLLHILIFMITAIVTGLIGGRWRGWLILIGSIVGLFWMQSISPIRNLDFWLPVTTLALTILTWLLTHPSSETDEPIRVWISPLVVIGGVVILIGALRYFDPVCCLTATRPPVLPIILAGLGTIVVMELVITRLLPGAKWKLVALIILLIGLLIILKTEFLVGLASAGLRGWTGQDVEQASALDIRWLGVSYIFFRLIHVLRDRQIGTLPKLSLPEFVSYVLFFPTLTAGPIDRVDRFIKDLRAPARLSTADAFEGGRRIVLGLLKKFALADSLALIALDSIKATQTESMGWLWVMLYAYALRLFLDFSGYSDIAIGLGRLMGFKVPENFQSPYLKTNMTVFWNSWHMTLAQWFRAYYFNPVSRAMRASKRAFSPAVIIGVCQMTTMILIGLWHGVTWNFVIWGAWHGVGLFIHNRWSSASGARMRQITSDPRHKAIMDALFLVVTFHYVTLGWVWFALADVGLSWQVMTRLFGL